MRVRDIFSDRIRKLCKAQGINQFMLGEKVHVDQSTISKLQNGKRDPNLELVVQLADSLHTSTDYLLGRTNSAEPVSLLGSKGISEYENSRMAYLFSTMSQEERELCELVIMNLMYVKNRVRIEYKGRDYSN